MSRPDNPAPSVGTTVTGDAPPRPRRADARRNRDLVLAAAREAFAAEGSHASLDEIARRAGVGAGTVYRHFATKEDLFEAVVLDRFGELVEEAHELRDDADPGRAFSSFVERLVREGALKRDLVEALAHDGIRLQLGWAPVVQALAGALAELLHRAQDVGAVRADVGVDDVMAVLTGTAFAISSSSGLEKLSSQCASG